MRRHLFKSRHKFEQLAEMWNVSPTYETMRHIALQMYCEGWNDAYARAHKEMDDEINEAQNNALMDEAFLQFWNTYDKKVGRDITLRCWKKLSRKDKRDILEYVPIYVKATPNKQYRKNPSTFLHQRAWEDEIIPTEYEERERERARRTGEAELLSQALSHYKLDK